MYTKILLLFNSFVMSVSVERRLRSLEKGPGLQPQPLNVYIAPPIQGPFSDVRHPNTNNYCSATRIGIRPRPSVSVSPSSAVKCSPCRKVSLNSCKSLLFHGGDRGSIPVRDAKFVNILRDQGSHGHLVQRPTVPRSVLTDACFGSNIRFAHSNLGSGGMSEERVTARGIGSYNR